MSSRGRDDRRDVRRDDRRDEYYDRRDSRRDDRRDDYQRGSRRDEYRRDDRAGHRPRSRDRRGEADGGASHLARIHGTALDRVNCMFYLKMGACRHGDKCDREHNKPAFSTTLLVPQMYQNPQARVERTSSSASPTQGRRDDDFEEFFVDLFEEVQKFGEVEQIVVCDNLCDHMLGNVYIKFFDEQDADKCLKGIKGRYYAGRVLEPEFSPVTDFRHSRCRQYDRNRCDRGINCSYMHIKRIDPDLEDDLDHDQPYKGHRSRPRESRSRSRSRSSSRSSGGSRSEDSLSASRSRSRSRSGSLSRSPSRSRSTRSSPSDSRGGKKRRSKRDRSRSRSDSRSHSPAKRRKSTASADASPPRSARLAARSNSPPSATKQSDVVDSMLGPISKR